MGGIGGVDGREPSMVTSWRPLVRDPLLPDALLSLRLSRGPTWPLIVPVFRLVMFNHKPPLPEVGGMYSRFCNLWLTLEPELLWAALEPAKARRVIWLNCSWIRMASSMEDWNCPPKSEVPTKVVVTSMTLRDLPQMPPGPRSGGAFG